MDESPLGGRYRRIRSLGAGTSGEVWLADDLVLRRQVAVKNIHAHLLADEFDLDRMTREALLTARLNHPHAVSVYDVVIENGQPLVVTEYIPGATMADRIAASGALPPAEVAAIGVAIADALTAAHALGIVHRDVQPANIVIDAHGVAKLADFGIAKIAGEPGGAMAGQFIGTPEYAAPEVVGGDRADEKSDVWSLGITLWTALEGRPPARSQDGDSMLVVLGRVLAGTVDPPPHGGVLGATVMQLLKREPGERPTAKQGLALLRDAAPRHGSPRLNLGPPRYHPPQYEAPEYDPPLRGNEERAYPDDLEDRSPDRRRRRAAFLLVALIAVAAAITGAAVWLGGSDTPSPNADNSRVPSPSGSRTVAAAGGQSYSAPGGISVTGPTGWDQLAGHATKAQWVDLFRPGTDPDHATDVRIGISNTQAPATIDDERRGAVAYARTVYSDYSLVGRPTASTFLGHPSVRIEFVGTKKGGVPKHVVELLWIFDNQTHVILLSAPLPDWDRDRPIFDMLTTSCKVA